MASNDFQTSLQERRNQLELTKKIRSLAASLLRSKQPIVSFNNHYVLRFLRAFEIETLQTSCGCRSNDWSNICLLLNDKEAAVDQSRTLKEVVSNTSFDGVVILALASPQSTSTTNENDTINSNDTSLDPWRKGPRGIHSNFLISNSIVSTRSWTSNNTVISDTHILPNSVVVSCGSVTAASSSSSTHNFLARGGAISLTVGPERGGGRNLTLTPECDMIQVCQQLRNGSAIKSASSSYGATTGAFVNMNIISSCSVLRNTPSIQGIYMAPHSSIHAATAVSNTILFPTATIRNACTVENARLQWNASISDHSNVSDCLCMEEAHIGPNSLVASTVLGPDVHVSAGEVHSSIIGPNTNAHHQSLVISVLWPLGRGNVGYGASIGSNHTGRIPDQETTSGEGVFWGLSCVIKFPVDLTMAPYSIVAAGTTMPPQRVCMPFSLIVSSNDAGNNNIIPGWVLSSSPYTVARSETKYATRRKAMRHKHYTGWKIIRPETIAMCRWARTQLESVAPNDEEKPPSTTYATDRVIKGIGSNILSEKGRRAGIKTYSDCVQKFALEGLLAWLKKQEEQGMIDEVCLRQEFRQEFQTAQFETTFIDIDRGYDNVSWPDFPWDMKPGQLWRYQKQILQEEFPCKGDIVEWVSKLLQALVVLEKDYAARIHKCKKRDDQRGASTVPGYKGCHVLAEMDPVIKQAYHDSEEVELAVSQLIKKMRRILSKL